MEGRELLIFGALAVISFIVAAVNSTVSNYAFIVGVVIIGFILYIYWTSRSESFDFIQYDEIMDANILETSMRSFRGEVQHIFLTGEDVYPNKFIGECVGTSVLKIDVDKNGKRAEKTFNLFIYNQYDTFFIKKLLQTWIPKMFLFNWILSNIPVIKWWCFPEKKGLIVPAEICKFKGVIVEINGISLLPLVCKLNYNAWSTIEYSNKGDSMRELEVFVFNRELMKSQTLTDYTQMKNGMDILVKFNPRNKMDQESKLMDTK